MSNGIWSGTGAGAGAWANAEVPSNAKLAAQAAFASRFIYFLPDWFCLWQTILAYGPLTAYQKRPERNNPDCSLVVIVVFLGVDCRNAAAHKSELGCVVVLCVSNSRSACERQ